MKEYRFGKGMGKILLASVSFSLLLVAARVWRSQSTLYVSLIWNLFLAWIPYLISMTIHAQKKWFAHPLPFFVAAIAWLLFFPNAPYIVTDLFHLKQHARVPLWYDLMVIFSFAWNGLILGYLSLMRMEREVQSRIGKAAAFTFVAFVLALAAYGVFLGRFLRWNSWDVLTNPFVIVKSILHMILHPFLYPGVWGMTLLFSVLLTLIYITLKKIPVHR